MSFIPFPKKLGNLREFLESNNEKLVEAYTLNNGITKVSQGFKTASNLASQRKKKRDGDLKESQRSAPPVVVKMKGKTKQTFALMGGQNSPYILKKKNNRYRLPVLKRRILLEKRKVLEGEHRRTVREMVKNQKLEAKKRRERYFATLRGEEVEEEVVEGGGEEEEEEEMEEEREEKENTAKVILENDRLHALPIVLFTHVLSL